MAVDAPTPTCSLGDTANAAKAKCTKDFWQMDYTNHVEAANDIADYILGFYDSIRLNSKLGNMSAVHR